MMVDMTMYQAIKNACIEFPKGTAIYYEKNKISFKKFLKLIDKTSDILYNQLGIRSGDVIIISQPNIPDTLILFYALNKIGAICNMVHPFTPFDKLYDIYHNTNCKCAFVFEQRVAKEVDKFKKSSMNLYITRIENYLPLFKKIFYHMFMNNKIRHKLARKSNFIGFKYVHKLKPTKKPVIENLDYNKPSVYLHSGSTTGDPKTICHSDSNFNFIVSKGLEFLSCKEEDIMGKGMLSVLPSFHGFGLCMGMHLPLVNKFACVLIPKFSIKKVCSAMNNFDVAVMIGVPTMYQTLLSSNEFKSLKQLKNLHSAFVGGDALPISIKNEFDELMSLNNSSCRLFEGYGLTETIAVNSVNTALNNRLGSVGKPISDVEIKICDENGKSLKVNEIGEIYLKTNSSMLYYLDDEELTKASKIDGWLKTGDLGCIDENGFLIFKGRLKNVVKVSGVMIFPNEIEAFILDKFKMIKTCAAIEIPDEKMGHAIKLFITPKMNECIFEDIKEKCSAYLIRWAVPKEFESRDSLPLTKLGKVDRKKLELIEQESRKNK